MERCHFSTEGNLFMTATQPSSLEQHEEQIAPENSSRAGILVVDDDPMVLCLLQVCLPRMGFSVWTANSGKAALAFFQGQHVRIDLVLLDVRMPVMDGPETLRELLRLDPNVKCCFMSGYTGVHTPESLLAMGGLALIDKPFNLDDLSRSLRQLVGQVRVSISA
jgi:CheY-like chemotaxis protein